LTKMAGVAVPHQELAADRLEFAELGVIMRCYREINVAPIHGGMNHREPNYTTLNVLSSRVTSFKAVSSWPA
jgi:hypothetical protein